MINRPPTRIELKLEDDLIDYEETVSFRKNIANNSNPSYISQSNDNYNQNISNIYNINNNSSPNFNLKFDKTPGQKNSTITKFISEDGAYEDVVDDEEINISRIMQYKIANKANITHINNSNNLNTNPDNTGHSNDISMK